MSLPSVRPSELRRLDVFRPLSDEELGAFVGRARERWLEPGDALFREGEAGGSLAIVVQGELTVRVQGVPGRAELAALGVGALVGEGSFLDAAPRSATVVAAAPAVIVEIDRAGFEALHREYPRVASRLLGAMLADVVQRLRGVDRRIAVELGEVSAFAPLMSPPGRPPTPSPRARSSLTPDALRAAGVALECSDEGLTALLAVCDERRYGAGELLSRQGEEARSCFIIVAGEVAVVKSLMAGERSLATLGPGAFAGQVALLDRARRSSTLRALAPVVALELDREVFERMVHASSPVALCLQRHLAAASARQLRAADRRLAGVLRRAARLPPAEAAADERRVRDLQYVQAAVGEVEMNLDVIELTDDDLLPAADASRASIGASCAASRVIH